ncbi:YacL family protein [Haemophilus haemolyticus]|nr:YacL family protein [Haemophilus haemolyticus]
MDFQFTHYQGNVSVKCSMEHIALANWFNTEVRSNPKAILTALSTAQSLSENQEEILIGAEYTLFLDTDEVMVRANNLAIETDEILEDDFHYYDEESIAFCGTQDFIHFLEAYVDFIS